jgi:hypothetical protein
MAGEKHIACSTRYSDFWELVARLTVELRWEIKEER